MRPTSQEQTHTALHHTYYAGPTIVPSRYVYHLLVSGGLGRIAKRTYPNMNIPRRDLQLTRHLVAPNLLD